MSVIYKYVLQLDGRQQFGSNPGRVVHVDVQHGSPCIWVEHDQTRHGYLEVDVRVTGQVFDPIGGGRHVGSFLLDGGAFVGHVYQVSA